MSLNLLPRGGKLLPHLKGLILLTPKTMELRNLVDIVMVNHLVSDPLFSSAHIFPVCKEDWMSFGENHILKVSPFWYISYIWPSWPCYYLCKLYLMKKEQFINHISYIYIKENPRPAMWRHHTQEFPFKFIYFQN